MQIFRSNGSNSSSFQSFSSNNRENSFIFLLIELKNIKMIIIDNNWKFSNKYNFLL